MTVCAVDTGEIFAVKLALVAPADTGTDDGTVTATALLVRPTAKPPVAAGAFSVTVHPSVPAPVMAELVQDRPVSTGTPVPFKEIDVDAPADELLVSVN